MVYINGKEVGKYPTFDELIYQFTIENKPFIDLIHLIEYED